ncbi:hypothetical protein BT96DRAFT_993026 [Gymnopus androsaceus JB14]|uniref:Uncharacterized protein n=1 Tax=Gymnopus androsaceus JB14 TaxID=1447944 RepID=A0A6A4HSM7_9AGAR|nr:hypothetical protein BT96DRAFT_993026 [Gymnopus androsaceus JB14]
MQDEDAEHHSQYCWTTFHLKCIKEWSEKSYKEVKAAWEAREEFNKDGEWRCPGCQGRRNKLIKGYMLLWLDPLTKQPLGDTSFMWKRVFSS